MGLQLLELLFQLNQVFNFACCVAIVRFHRTYPPIVLLTWRQKSQRNTFIRLQPLQQLVELLAVEHSQRTIKVQCAAKPSFLITSHCELFVLALRVNHAHPVPLNRVLLIAWQAAVYELQHILRQRLRQEECRGMILPYAGQTNSFGNINLWQMNQMRLLLQLARSECTENGKAESCHYQLAPASALKPK